MARKRKTKRAQGPGLVVAANADAPAGQRRALVEAALLLMEQVYVHLPLKRAMHSINPVQKLRLLAQEADSMTERQFHGSLLSIFLGLRDLHTNYILPAPMNRHTAYLPFRIAEFYAGGVRQYVVTQVFKGSDPPPPPSFVPGVIVTHWNGIPMDRAVDINAEREAGGNAAARHARGLESLTLRWLGMSLPPDEDWVDVTYHSPATPSQPVQARFQWMLYHDSAENLGVGQAKGPKAAALGLDMRAEMERRVRRLLFSQSIQAPIIAAKRGETLKTLSPAVFPRCANVNTRSGRFAYIRIATFDVGDDRKFVQEFIRLVTQLTPNGLIIDVRGNGGGLVLAGERLLQCLTPQRIEPEKFHFINSKVTLQLCQNLDFKCWMESISQATRIGSEFSAGFSLLSEDQCNDIGQIYQGPVVLITDALCYSTTDIFAAGFQDHGIGKIIGVSENTGAGGANVWDYSLLQYFLPGADSPFKPLPQNGAQFRVAIRRTTRVRARAGQPLEDLGVQPDERHQMTYRDVMEGNKDLIEFAASILAGQPTQRLSAAVENLSKGKRVVFTSHNVDRVDIYLNQRPVKSVNVPRSSVRRSMPIPVTFALRKKGNVAEVQGFRDGKLVVATRARF